MFLLWSCIILKLWYLFNSNGCEVKTKSKLNYYHQGLNNLVSLEVILTLPIFKLILIGTEMILTAYRIVKSLAVSAGLLNVAVLVVFCLLVWVFLKCILLDLNRICGLSQFLLLFHIRFSSFLGSMGNIIKVAWFAAWYEVSVTNPAGAECCGSWMVLRKQPSLEGRRLWE